MVESRNQSDHPLEPQVPERLAEDLVALYGTDVPVPSEVDATMKSLARGHFAARRRARMLLRLVEVSAAAAVIALVVWIGRTPDTPSPKRERGTLRPTPSMLAQASRPQDDASTGPGTQHSAAGTQHSVLDIAARDVSEPASPSAMSRISTRNSELATRNFLPDIDQNGRVDILDAFALARRIEARAELPDEWDLNGDGAIDWADVDTAALAAVSLHQG